MRTHLAGVGPAVVLEPVDLAPLDRALLDGQGLVRLLPAADLHQIPRPALRYWLHMRAVYGLPTTELIAWLQEQIGERRAIEIGAGNGALGRALGIPRTDSHVQQTDEMKQRYASLSIGAQAPVSYPPDVKRMEALDAVDHYRPHTVVASWVSQKWRPGDEQAFVYGVDEWALLKRVRRYIFIGALSSHDQKRILTRPHETYAPPWLVSRAEPGIDRIWVFQGRRW